MAVNFEHVPADGTYRISRTFQCLGAAAAGAKALEMVNEAAFDPVPNKLPQQAAPEPVIIPHALAAAMMRDEVPPDDDEGDAIPGVKCAECEA